MYLEPDNCTSKKKLISGTWYWYLLLYSKKKYCDYLVPGTPRNNQPFPVPDTDYRYFGRGKKMAALLEQKTGCTAKNNNQPVKETTISNKTWSSFSWYRSST
jgi:hypothetical protein